MLIPLCFIHTSSELAFHRMWILDLFVIHGGHANGLIAWKNKNGKTLTGIESV